MASCLPRPSAVCLRGHLSSNVRPRMPFAPKIVLHCPTGYRPTLDTLVEQWLSGGVKFVAVVGQDCERIESIIDELVVGDGSNTERYLLTSSHPGESVAQAVTFAQSLSMEYSGEVQVLEV
jgi:hypothetical protein